MEVILDFTIPYPKIGGTSKQQNRLCTINNLPYWYRWSKTRIKTKLVSELLGWSIPLAKEEIGTNNVAIVFEIVRHNNRKIDADSCAMIGKWIADLIVIQKYIKDDDILTFIYKPPVVHTTDNVETMINIKLVKDLKWI